MSVETIYAYGLKTRVWTFSENHGYGCAECCNKDRCDEECTATYERKDCPHCKGKGWIQKEAVEEPPPEQKSKSFNELRDLFKEGTNIPPDKRSILHLEAFVQGYNLAKSEALKNSDYEDLVKRYNDLYEKYYAMERKVRGLVDENQELIKKVPFFDKD